jgi:hypothetical protein
MDDQSSSQATNAAPTREPQSNVLNEENWIIDRLPFTEDSPARGFLQLCADRRFHECIQREFKKDANLTSREDYWIHADAGGTPKMASQKVTPNYCYFDNKVRLMGWSAHGDNCGGFGAGVGDVFIRRALCETMQGKVKEYPEAKHFIYFVTVYKDQDKDETVVYRMICEPGLDIVCEKGSE